jgi:hypothetical protein
MLIKYGPKIKTIISGTINITDIILTLFGILFICFFISNIRLSLKKSTWLYSVSNILLPNCDVCTMFNIMLLMVSDDILSFKLISDSFNDFPYFSSSKHFPNSSDISELTL